MHAHLLCLCVHTRRHCDSTRARCGLWGLRGQSAGAGGLNADLEKVLELLAQAAEDAERIGAVTCELAITDAHGAGVLFRYVGEADSVTERLIPNGGMLQ